MLQMRFANREMEASSRLEGNEIVRRRRGARGAREFAPAFGVRQSSGALAITVGESARRLAHSKSWRTFGRSAECHYFWRMGLRVGAGVGCSMTGGRVVL